MSAPWIIAGISIVAGVWLGGMVVILDAGPLQLDRPQHWRSWLAVAWTFGAVLLLTWGTSP